MKCEQHESHDTLTEQIDYNGQQYSMVIYNWAKYLDPTSHFWCPANDVISENIRTVGFWEIYETALIDQILDLPSDSKNFIDLGSQLGWYSLRAADKGYNVYAVEADSNTAALLKSSAELNGFKILVDNKTIDKDSKKERAISTKLFKVDIEGQEEHALRVYDDSFRQGLVEYAVFEISPIFNDSYTKILEKLELYGYNGYRIPTGSEDWCEEYMKNPLKTIMEKSKISSADVSGWKQENILFTRKT